MRLAHIVLLRSVVLLKSVVLLMCMVSQAFAEMPVTAERKLVLRDLLLNDCGACHGMTMKGGLGLPLTPEALRDKDSNGLLLTILDGRPGTAMPPWRRFLSEADARWMLQELQRGLSVSEP